MVDREELSDNDGRPGNSGESTSYSQIYDPRGEGETSNLIEPQDRIEARTYFERVAKSQKAAAEQAMRAAQNDVHFFPGMGKFIIPEDTTWAAHAKIVLDNDSNLFFSPEKYPDFDKIIADKLKIPALTNRNHKDFAKYRGLRTNLEVLRNDLIGQYLDDGAFNPGDQAYIPKIRAIATALGEALANDQWFKRPFTKHLSLGVASVEAVGAAEMYKFLLDEQDKTQHFSGIRGGFRNLASLNDKNWGLLPIEKTPFSEKGLSSPLPIIPEMITAETAKAMADEAAAKARAEALQQQPMQQAAQKMGVPSPQADKSHDLINTTKKMQSVDSLLPPTKENSVEEGRTILRWLRNLQLGDRDAEEWLGSGTPTEQTSKADMLGKLVDSYAQQMAAAHNTHPERLSHDDVLEGRDAAGGASMMIAEHALSQLPKDSDAARKLEAAIDAMPESYFERSHQPLARLLDSMENGMAQMAGTNVHERSAEERLREATTKLNANAKSLRSVDTLETPKREESVELGREILRKLKKLLSNDKPFDEAIDTGRPEDKVRLAQYVEEISEIYKNMLARVAINKPEILRNKKIEEANDAVGTFSHAISLMAAKEMPGNAAATQQISAEAAQMPDKWKGMSGQTLDRLMKHITEAIEQLGQEQQAQDTQRQQEEDNAQQMMQANANATGSTRRKRKRRSSSGAGGKKAEKVQQELSADDAAAGQGRYRERKETAQSAYMGLSEKDISAIRDVGGSLRDLNSQAIGLSAMDVPADKPVMPDDKSAAQQAIEQATSRRSNRNNNNAANTTRANRPANRK